MWIAKDAIRALLATLTALAAWCFFAPFAYLWPRNSRLVVVLGRENGLFLDNCKYFFSKGIFRQTPTELLKFYTSDPATNKRLQPWQKHLVYAPSFKAILTLLRAGVVVVDSAEWVRGGKYQLTLGANIVQLWHGAPLKEIELPLHEKRIRRKGVLLGSLYKLAKKIAARYPKVDLFVSCSPFFTEKAFAKQFEAAKIIDTGFPRNDILFHQEGLSDNSLQMINVERKILEQVATLKKSGHKVILYAPTFRQKRDDPCRTGHLDLEGIQTFCSKNDLCMIFKLHPSMKGRYSIESYELILEYDPHLDVYPLMAYTDLLVTDYSSIYFDYLLLDKPIVYYPYDFEQYTQDDRALLFEYDEMAPGPQCRDQISLKEAIMKELKDLGEDYSLKRQKVRSKTFLHHDGEASSRVWDFISTNFFHG